MRKFVVLASLFGAYFLSLIYVYWWGKVAPNTYLPSGVTLARLTEEQVHKLIDDIVQQNNVALSAEGKDITVSYAKLGLSVDHDAIEKELFSDSDWHEVVRITRGLVSAGRKKEITLHLTAVKNSVYLPVTGGTPSRIVYATDSGKFVYDPPKNDYQVDVHSLVSQVEAQFGAPSPTLTTTPLIIAHKERQLEDLNVRLTRAAAKELVVRVKDGTTYGDIPIYPDEIKRMLTFSQKGDTPLIDVDRSVFESLVATRLSDQQKPEFQIDVAYPNAVAALSERFSLKDVDAVVLGIDDGPTSDGSLADRYIEVDLSQQKMYFFEGGKVAREFRVSTGYDYPTPVGEYHILNKAPKAFSDIYDVWMDYWMGFKYANDIGAYLGIHEIAYNYNDNGQRFYRLGNYIGEPRTGGCIALHPGEARALYDMSTEGMLVRVVE